MSATFDVLLPVYNGEATVGQAVESLLRQTLADIRVIIVDDGSGPACETLLGQLAASDARIHLVRQGNAGIVAALNAGLALADAPFIARQDADDISAPDRLERQLQRFLADPALVACSGRVRHIDKTGIVHGSYGPPDPAHANAKWAPSIEPYLIHPFLAMRREAVLAIGGYRPVHHAEDTDLYWRLREHGMLANLPDILGDYRMHDESISGGSAVNGRIMAIHSQLAALSSRRRARDAADVDFAGGPSLSSYKAASTLNEMMEMASAPLSAEEADWLGIAVAAKMLELSSYRPWHLSDADLTFIRTQRALRRDLLSPANRAEIDRAIQRASVDLLYQGRAGAMRSFADVAMYPGVAARAFKRAARSLSSKMGAHR